MNDERRRRHISNMGNVFIPQERIAQIKWEECVRRAQYKREGIANPRIEHFTCRCGDISCVGVPIGRRYAMNVV